MAAAAPAAVAPFPTRASRAGGGPPVVYFPGNGGDLDASHERVEWALRAVEGDFELLTVGWDETFWHDADDDGWYAKAPYRLTGDGFDADPAEFSAAVARALKAVEVFLAQREGTQEVMVLGQVW